jgi:hypothetical protein
VPALSQSTRGRFLHFFQLMLSEKYINEVCVFVKEKKENFIDQRVFLFYRHVKWDLISFLELFK